MIELPAGPGMLSLAYPYYAYTQLLRASRGCWALRLSLGILSFTCGVERLSPPASDPRRPGSGPLTDPRHP